MRSDRPLPECGRSSSDKSLCCCLQMSITRIPGWNSIGVTLDEWRATMWLLMALFCLLSVTTAVAGSFMIEPVKLTLSDAKPSSVLRVENRGDAMITVQLKAMAWSQADNQDQLTDSRELIATPPVFRLRPGQQQVVRVALLRPADEHRELPYRLLLDEVPPPPAADFRGLQMALRISMPVFVEPRTRMASMNPCTEFRVARDGPAAARLVLANRGQAHLQFKTLHLGTPPSMLLSHDKAFYLLPGQQRELPLKLTAGLSSAQPLMFRAQTASGDVECHVPVAAN